MRKLLTLFLTAASIYAFAEFTPVPERVEFGTINETDGIQTDTIFLVNTGDSVNQITRVRTSCGCTLAAYDDEEVQPGDTAWVEISYNPTGRIGKFEKMVRVTDNSRNTITIPVGGTIRPSEETVKELYPIIVGPLALSGDKIMMQDLKMGTSKHAFMEVYNYSDTVVKPVFVSLHNGVEVVGKAREISPYNFETYGFYVKSSQADSVGHNKFTIDLYADGDTLKAPFPIDIFVNITE